MVLPNGRLTHHPQRPFLIVLDQQHQDPGEVRVRQLRRSHQQLAFERFHAAVTVCGQIGRLPAEPGGLVQSASFASACSWSPWQGGRTCRPGPASLAPISRLTSALLTYMSPAQVQGVHCTPHGPAPRPMPPIIAPRSGLCQRGAGLVRTASLDENRRSRAWTLQ